MPITSSGSVRPGAAPRPSRRKAAAETSGGRFVLDDVGAKGAAASEAAPQTAVVTAPYSLLSMQEAFPEPAPLNGRARAVHQGHDLLDRLDDLRRAIVAGVVTPSHLDDLASALAAERAASGDPDLDALIGEIELRAAVEMAKNDRQRRPETASPDVEHTQLSHFLSKV